MGPVECVATRRKCPLRVCSKTNLLNPTEARCCIRSGYKKRLYGCRRASSKAKAGKETALSAISGQVRSMYAFKCVLIYNIDGGGTGGLSQIFILDEIIRRLKYDLGPDESPRVCDYFDMIGGVGMGG